MEEDMVVVRILEPGDEAVLERFLVAHRDTTMFLRSNAARAGLAYGGERFQGVYAAAFEAGEVVAVASHAWNGNLILEAPVHLEAVLRSCVEASGRGVRGFVGRATQVQAARRLLGLAQADAVMDSDETLFGLDLERLRVPAALTRGDVLGRRALARDAPQLSAWGVAYGVEALGAERGPDLQAWVAAGIRSGTEAGTVWVLEAGGRPVAMTRFNATMPDCVQVGGVYTPPELRSRGYARAALAASLLGAREEGVGRSILFTAHDNHPAQACYRGLGYEAIGGYGLVLLRADHDVL